MNELFIYLIKAATINAIILAFYYFTLRESNRFRLMRLTLLIAMILPLLYPLIPYPFEFQQNSANLPVFRLNLPETVVAQNSFGFSLNWANLSRLLYYGISLLLIVGMIISIISIIQKRLRAQQHHTLFGKVELERSVKSPFSFFSWVFLSPSDLTHPQLDMILQHEFCHVREKHSIDRILSGVFRSVLWFSPFAHATSRLLSEVHEYQADSKVIGVYDKSDYSDLILSFYMNPQSSGISNNFSLHIKNRINMINNLKFSRLRYGRILTGLGISLSLVLLTSMVTTQTSQLNTEQSAAIQKGAIDIGNDLNFTLVTNSPDTIRKALQVKKTQQTMPDSPPQYPGGNNAQYKFIVSNLVYPEDARKAGIEGTVYVQFIIEPTGKITNAKVLKGVSTSIDKAALDVVNKMPDWIPAKIDNKPASFEMTMPFKFKLSDDKEDQVTKDTKADLLKSNEKLTPQKIEGSEVFTVVEVAPQFPGGDDARTEFINKNITYPEQARKEGIQGTVYLTFVVQSDGSITHAKVLRGVGGGLDEIALEVVKKMPKWEPGIVKGEPVPVLFNMPIKFKLTKDENKPVEGSNK